MTNKEAIKYLIPPVVTSTEPSAEYLKQREAYELAITALKFIDENYPKTFIDYLNEVNNAYKRGYEQGKKEFERPQGEILVEHCIEFNSNPSSCRNCHRKCTWFKCSKCSCVVDTEDKFCKHCGAELKGKEE